MTYIAKTLFAAGLLCGLPAAAMAQNVQSVAASEDSDAADDEAGVWRLSTGLNHSRGRYGDAADTAVWSLPIGIKYSQGPISIRVSIPYIRLEGPGSILDTPEAGDGGGDGHGQGRGRGRGRGGSGSGSSGGSVIDDDSDDDNGGGGDDGDNEGEDEAGDAEIAALAAAALVNPADRVSTGFGDVSVTAVYSIDLGSDFYADVSGRVKLPTASRAKRLGSGEVDVTLGMDLIKDIGDVSLYAGARHKFSGDSAVLPLRNVWGFSVGGSVAASDKLTIGADFDRQEAAVAGNRASSEITGWMSYRLTKAATLSTFLGTGLNANSADLIAGGSISLRF